MGDTLRELVTRFGFETDKAGVDRFNKTVGGMKKQVVGLAGALGVGLGGRQLLRFGEDARQTEVAFEGAVSGIDDGLERITGSIDKLLGKGELLGELGKLGEIVTPQQGQAIAASFFGAFEDASDETLGTFETFLRAAVTLTALTGGKVTDAFGAIFQAAREGTIDPLLVLPGITAETARQFQFVTGLLGDIDPTNVAQLAVNMGRVREKIEDVLPDIEKFVQQNATDLLAAREASAKLQESMQTLGAKAVKALEEPLDILSQFVGKLNDGKDASDALGESLAGVELPSAVRSALETVGVLEEQPQTQQQRERQFEETRREERETALQRRRSLVEFAGGEESRIGGAIQSFFELTVPSEQDERQPVPVVVEQPGERVIVAPPTPESPAPPTPALTPPVSAPIALPQRDRPRARTAPVGVPLPAQAPIPEAISRLETKIERMANAQRPRAETAESKLEVTVRHEGRVQTFPDRASFQRALGEELDRILVEFPTTETTEVR